MSGEILYNVPVFPLNTVLFPGVPLPLQIFEPRYLAMVNDLKRRDNRFCVSHIVSGEEVGGPAVPAPVGCLAEIVQLEPMPGERYFLVAVGVERVKILSLDDVSKPYLVGSLEVLAEDEDSVDAQTVSRARKLFSQYMDCILKLSGREDAKIPLPAEPDLLSYLLAAVLQVDAEVRQRLLEAPDNAERLKAEISVLEGELPVLRSMLAGVESPGAGYGQFSAN